jgi:cephalosporin hydroxylase
MSEEPSAGSGEHDDVVRRFAELWWEDPDIYFGQHYMGIRTLQHPFDAWITQEIISETRPERIVEAGAFCGGSATMWAMLLDQLVPDGRVISIDLVDSFDQARQIDVCRRRVDFITGSTVDPAVVADVGERVAGKRTMVILDSAHDEAHVTKELAAYAGLVSVGCYLIVQDGVVNGHPLVAEHGPGPFEAVERFMQTDDRFVVDRARERMLFTFNPNGFLRRER